ncbi:MAG: MBL fold metallo-hydrolase [Lentisphaerae bacterium]|nr:MBL fold metallo-hydrolase [Lentisphaerota bacterium]MBT4821312.1 MBL fold metallo-hydrolase [Lentisphaerota bacterium]MBT5612845.1 MBL fold metallo-hydrolase [Lentisphaerota bacterium]MBT7059691.1 MBL fold metallo-hydrolase [Lentisphaerota bacterium]MBT7841584.1 MBL fold metallo-hydrolase [Lentisphaerota bacterium]
MTSSIRDTTQRLQIGFWGARGSISTPGRLTEKYGGNTPCVSVRLNDTHIVFDAGTGIRNLGLELARDYADRSEELSVHLFLSHTHWDHIQGIPFFEPAYMQGAKVTIYGSSAKHGFFEEILRGQMGYEYFPVTMSDLPSELRIRELEGETLALGDLVVSWEEQIYHPGGSLRYRVQGPGSDVVYASDIELNKCFVPDPDIQRAGEQKRYLDFIHDADLLIADGQYTAEEYPAVEGYGHTTIELLTEIAYQAQVKRLAVFHHDPKHPDRLLDALWQEYRAKYATLTPPMGVFWAREGQIIPV